MASARDALAACQQLCLAYALGDERGGSVDHFDVDAAYGMAVDALEKAGWPVPQPRKQKDAA